MLPYIFWITGMFFGDREMKLQRGEQFAHMWASVQTQAG